MLHIILYSRARSGEYREEQGGCVPIGIQPFLPVKNTVSHVWQIFTIIGDFLTPPRFAGGGLTALPQTL